MQEHFVEYLLGSLDPITHTRVEAYLNAHPEERERLQLLEQALAPLAEDADQPAPPPGLVMATLARVAEQRCSLPSAPAPSRHQVGNVARRHFRPVDWVAAAILLLLVGGLAFPFVLGQWRQHQRLACSNNLRQLFVALSAYGDRNDGEFPRVEPTGPRGVAGIFVPLLNDAGLLPNSSIDCPARSNHPPTRCSVADMERMYRDAPNEYRSVAERLAGHYAYCLGYKEGDSLQGLRRDSGDGLALMADRSTDAGGNSDNHAGAGQNVLYVGGNVRWCVQPTVGEDRDNIYVNRLYKVNAGVCRSDSVLGASDTQPYQAE